jgi:hypothetical protein
MSRAVQKRRATRFIVVLAVLVGMAKNQMRKEFKEGVSPLLLLDEDGHVRTGLGVPKGETWVLAFDSGGQRRLVEKGPPSAAAAKRLWVAAQK